jgi:hypothetical protein
MVIWKLLNDDGGPAGYVLTTDDIRPPATGGMSFERVGRISNVVSITAEFAGELVMHRELAGLARQDYDELCAELRREIARLQGAEGG